MLFQKLERYGDVGLLIIRVGIGAIFLKHGWPKITGGMELWTSIGGNMSMLGIDFLPAFWGFMAAFSEFFGGLLIMLGLFFRPACMLLTFTMFVAFLRHFTAGDPFGRWAHPLKVVFTAGGLIFIGPGKYSLDAMFFRSGSDT